MAGKVVDVWGLEKAGKTYLSLYLAFRRRGPVVYFELDAGGIDHILDDPPGWLDQGRLNVVPVDLPDPDAGWKEYDEAYQAFVRTYREAILFPDAAVIVDTATSLWDIVQQRFLLQKKVERLERGAKEQLYPFDYADANKRYQWFLAEAKRAGCLLLLIHQAQRQYDDQGRPTGELEPRQWNRTPYEVNLRVRVERTTPRARPYQSGDRLAVNVRGNLQRVYIIEEHRRDPSLIGTAVDDIDALYLLISKDIGGRE